MFERLAGPRFGTAPPRVSHISQPGPFWQGSHPTVRWKFAGLSVTERFRYALRVARHGACRGPSFGPAQRPRQGRARPARPCARPVPVSPDLAAPCA